MALTAHVRFLRHGLAAAVLAGLGVASAPAHSESMYGAYWPDVGQSSVAASVMRQGFVVRSAVVRRGDVYLCDASDPRGFMERLVIDSRTGRIVQRYAFRSVAYAAEPQRFAPPVGGGWLLTSPPRPYVDVPQPRPQVVEAYPEVDEPAPIHRRLLAYGPGREPTAAPPEPKPVEPHPTRTRTARPKPAWTAPPVAKPSDNAALPSGAGSMPTAATESTKPAAAAALAPSEPVKPAAAAALAPSEPAKPAAASALAPSEPVKPAAVAPPKSVGVVASSGPAESAPVRLAQPPAIAPVAAPAPSKPKAINDIPVAPLD